MANTVSYLQSISFSKMTLHEKCEIKNMGRPTPDLKKLTQEGTSHNKPYTRSFSSEWYNKIDWLCGCKMRNRLFCFPCLLFGGDTTWARDGFGQINKLKEKCRKHEISGKHMNNVVSLTILGQEDNTKPPSEAYTLSKIKHNEQVLKNCNVLSKLIDAIKFCAHFGLPLRAHNESECSDNQGVFRGLLDYQAKVDPELREHLCSNSAFKGTSKTIQNELLQCIVEVIQDHIAAEIREASFLALMVDDTTDVNGLTQTVIVFRYELHGSIYERFWGYFQPEDVTVDGLSQCILTELKKVLENGYYKLIAQTYKGASLLSGSRQGVKEKIQDVYNHANNIHCYAHPLNLIMKHVTSSIQSVRSFFMDFKGITAFFSQSPKRLEILKKHMTAGTTAIPRPSNIHSNCNIRTVNDVFENKDELIACFQEMLTFQREKTFDKAKGFLALLKNDNFLFWLEYFHKILPHAESLFSQMQSRKIDSTFVQEAIESFCSAIQNIRADCEDSNMGSKSNVADSKEVCDRIMMECKERFAFTSHLVVAKLFYSENFVKYSKKMPKKEIAEACQIYPYLDMSILETELSVFYSRTELHNFNGLISLLRKFMNANLVRLFQETTKLLRILVTMPMTTAEPERCFSTLKTIKTNQKNSMYQERLLALSMVSIEKNMISTISDFNQKVIENFCAKSTMMDFMFQ